MIRRLADPDVELLVEEFVPVLVVFKRLESRGVRFDPALSHLLKALERQVYDGGDDGDCDYTDQWLEPDDADEDAAASPRPLWRQIQHERCGKAA
ncbi:MAG TPA: hypothetical protein VF669_13225 [Tepidisphaeraceae bacterium]